MKKKQLQVVFLSELPYIVNELAQKIIENNFTPTFILYIERAGRLPAYLLHERLGGCIEGIFVSRPGGKLKTLLSPLLRLIPEKIRNTLRALELIFFRVVRRRKVEITNALPNIEDYVLIVDDAVDTGLSIESVVEILNSIGISESHLKIATITTTLANRRVQPDFVCFRGIKFVFPWSHDSMQHAEYQQIYELCGDKKVDIKLIKNMMMEVEF